ncbi:hypothetical protein UCREL1_10210 [Eutypa lata UCREL1]|uniref:FHA domain-containing protein n=1 Tax=Eutypa lata (strain UCR-EL1) TaxID=1287681 RepID=M7T871_EUTLA|nr:hypothetical protein UCREL1_10210 [Eutypa lata UCREL1]
MPNWEKDTGFGKVVDRLSLDNFGLFVHVGNVEQAELIKRINSFHIRNQLVLIDEPEDFWDVHGGIIALRAAQMTSGQKKRFQLPLLVFGRSVLADVSLTQTGRQGIAQFHFGLEIINEIWVVQHLGGKWTKVNGVLLKEKNQVYALHPKMPNRVQIQGIELGLYCRNTRLFDMDDQESLWIAKTFAGTVQEQERLKAHIDLLEGLPVESFIRDEQVKAQGGQFLSLSRYRPNVWPLSELDGAETPDQQQYRGRRLLWNLLRLVARVHKLGITHRDICMDTVFLSDEEDYESILLVFRTVESFFGEVSLPPNWIGNAALDRLWSSGYSDIDSWPTPQQLCEDIRAFDNDERWSTISVSVQYAIKRMCDEAGDFVMTDAVRPYVAKHLVRHGYKDKMARALAVLQEGSYEGRIYLDVYRRVDKKMRREDVEIPYLDMDFLGSEDNQTVAEVSD